MTKPVKTGGVFVYDADEKSPWYEVFSPPVFLSRESTKRWKIRVAPGLGDDAQKRVFEVGNSSGVYPKAVIPSAPPATNVANGFHALGFYEIKTSLNQTGYLEVRDPFIGGLREWFYIDVFQGLSWPKRATQTAEVAWELRAVDPPADLDRFSAIVKFNVRPR